jgi:4-hydroxybenzoate polyprenyltransferase
MRHIFYLIISHAVFIAICAASLVFQTEQLLGYEINLSLILFVFFSTLCSYNFHWLIGSISENSRLSMAVLSKKKSNVFFGLFGFAGLAIFFTNSGVSYLDAFVAGLFTLLYSIPLLPVKQLAFTKKAGFLKTVLLAFTWTYVTAYIPSHHYEGESLSISAYYLFARRFLFMLMLCILFDNRDKATDKIKGLHSLATDLSASTMKWLIYILFAMLFILPFLMEQYGITARQSVALQLTAMATLVTYFFSLKKQGYFFYYFLVDGLMLLSALLTTIASI